jgi:glycosyltransferase involved in cell wall biosynthesis
MPSTGLLAQEELPSRSGNVRILHVHSGNLFGGVEWFLRTLGQRGALHAPWVTSDFALCFEGRIAHDLRNLGATVHLLGPVRFRSSRSVGLARKAFARVLEVGRYDVVVCHSAWPHALFAPVARARGASLVQFMHDVPNRLGWLDHLASLTPPDLVLCNSHFMEASGRWWFRNVPRRMIRYPVPTGERTAPTARAELRASLGARATSVVILLASRMQAWKGHRLLIAALERLRANPRWTCWIAGGAQRPAEDAYEAALRREVARLGLERRITFLGHRDDVPALMDAADLHCQPNVSPEPFGVVFAEALSRGLPIVTTAMGGPLEIVDGRCGVLVPPAAQPLAGALSLLIDDDERRAALSRAAPKRAGELWDVETRVRELANALSSVSPTHQTAPTTSLARLVEPSRVRSGH